MLLAKRMAWLLLDTYAACADAADMEQQLMAGLAVLTGGFAFVLHDRSRHRVVAARDRAGQQPLLWGMTADAALVFSSSTASAIDQAEEWTQDGEKFHCPMCPSLEPDDETSAPTAGEKDR